MSVLQHSAGGGMLLECWPIVQPGVTREPFVSGKEEEEHDYLIKVLSVPVA